MTVVNPVQTSTYNILTPSNPITFGSGTDINVAAGYAVYGNDLRNWSVAVDAQAILAGGLVFTASSTVTNAGAISNTHTGGVQVGVKLTQGGKVINLKGGTVSGGYYGVQAGFGVGAVTNAGTISGGSIGVALDQGGSVVNQSGGTISGHFGVVMYGASAKVTNAGKITGGVGGAAVAFRGGGVNVLTLQTGSNLVSTYIFGSAASGATNALVLQGDGSAANKFVRFNTLTVKASGVWTLGGASSFGATNLMSGTLAVAGSITSRVNEAVAASLTVASGKALTLFGSSTLLGSVAGPGAVRLWSAAKATVGGSVAAGSTFAFVGPAAGDLVLDDLDVGGADLFHAKIAGFAKGDKIDAGAPFGAGTHFTFSENSALTSGVLTLIDGATQASLTLLGNHAAGSFHLAGDGGAGTLVTYG